MSSFDTSTESGVITLGPSKNAPIPQAIIQNLNERNWLTIENTLALPIGVCPIQSGSGLITPSLVSMQIPPFTRCTIPIDSSSDVLLNCLGNKGSFDLTQWNGTNTFSDLQIGTFAKKNITYMLHDNGNMFQSDLYPNLIPVGGQQSGPAGNLTTVYYIQPNVTLGANMTWLWPQGKGVYDPVIMAISLRILFFSGDPNNISIRPAYDFDTTVSRHTSFTNAITPFTTIGQLMTLKCPGAIAFAVQNFDAAAVTLWVNAWIAIPGQ